MLSEVGALLILLYPSTRGFSFSFMKSVIFLVVLLIKIKIIQKDYIKVSINISAHLSMKIILLDPYLVRTFLVIIFEH